jgi:hypothetical protein
MKIVEFLNKSIRSEMLVKLFEDYNVDVIYLYDRLHEGVSDRYCGSIAEMGLEFLFDENKLLKTIFIFTQETESYAPANLEGLALQSFNTKASAIDFAENYKEGSTRFLGSELDWVKLIFGQHSIHYQYSNSILNQVTLQTENA